MMKTSRNGILFIACREGLVLTAYPDGKNNAIGFGHNSATVKPGATITVAEAFALLASDLAPREKTLNADLKVQVEQQQFDALMSLYYNTGSHYLPKLLALINAGKADEAAALFPSCNVNAAGQVLAGLTTRRLEEQAMFTSGNYGALGKIPFWRGNPKTTKMATYAVQPGDLP